MPPHYVQALLNWGVFLGKDMYERFLELKKTKSWLFYLLIIPFVFIAIMEFYNRYLMNSGKKVVVEAEKKDEDLKAKQEKAEQDAKDHEEKADKIEEEIDKEKVDKDWHLH